MPDGQPQPEELAAYLDGLARPGAAVSAVEVLVADSQQIRFRHAAGYRVGGERLQAGARFDAASLTKPWMATLALVLDRVRLLPLELTLREIFPSAKGRGAGCTLEDLLRHRSGIVAWVPLGLRLGKRLADRTDFTGYLFSDSLWPQADAPRGALSVYSDLGYILWGLAAERVTGRSLADLLDAHVAEPLGLAPLGALAARPPAEAIVECRLDNWREVELAAELGLRLSRQAPFLRGVPQDGNARASAFLTGHAGLFATAEEMLALAREWLRPERLLTAEGVARALAGEGLRVLGWVLQSADGSSGPDLEPAAFGHAGFTGGSLWIEPVRQRLVLVLAHRLSSRLDMNQIRREIHRLAGGL